MMIYTLYGEFLRNANPETYSKSSVLEIEDVSLVRFTYGGKDSNNNSVIQTESHTTSKLKIGKYASIAMECTFMLGGNHNYSNITTFLPFDIADLSDEGRNLHLLTNGDIIIGHDVWIGNNATIMSGITIGTGSVIAANSTITKDVPPYTIVGGNPAKIIRKRFDDETISFLLESKWWNIDRKILEENSKALFNTDIQKFKKFISEINS